jgi:hypothetical protein
MGAAERTLEPGSLFCQLLTNGLHSLAEGVQPRGLAEPDSPGVCIAVCGYLYVFGSGLLGQFLFRFFLEDTSFPGSGIFFLQWIPCFALYRGLYEFAQAAFIGNYQGRSPAVPRRTRAAFSKRMTFMCLCES